jgi:hypothetical protein
VKDIVNGQRLAQSVPDILINLPAVSRRGKLGSCTDGKGEDGLRIIAFMGTSQLAISETQGVNDFSGTGNE